MPPVFFRVIEERYHPLPTPSLEARFLTFRASRGLAQIVPVIVDKMDLDALEFRFMWPDSATSEWSTVATAMSFARAGTYHLRASAKDSKKIDWRSG